MVEGGLLASALFADEQEELVNPMDPFLHVRRLRDARVQL
jgi:hypothetical protein